jgi:hypothetical protein
VKEEIISIETAQLAKGKEFTSIQEYGIEASLYNNKNKHVYYANYGLSDGYISAPTQSFLQK